MSLLGEVPDRVLMTADAAGGVWQYALELVRGLCRRGTQVLLAVMGPEPSPVQRAAAASIHGLSLHCHPGRLEWMRDAERDLEDGARWLSDLQAAFDPDIIHLNGYAQAAAAWSVPVVVVCHSCVLTWWRAVHGTAAPAEWNEYARRVAWALQNADLVIAPSRAFLAAMAAIYGQPPQIMVIPNGRGGRFRPRVTKDPLIFCCGRSWDEAKGMGALEAVASRLPWPVYLAGDLRSPEAAGWATPASLRSLGRLDEDAIAAFLARAAIFALPARYEPFGLAILEAAMSGCALVLGDIDTLRELWGGAALFVDPRDEQALLDAIMRLIGDPDLCRTMGGRALQHARNYRTETMVDAYLDAYRRASLLRNGTAAAGRDAAPAAEARA